MVATVYIYSRRICVFLIPRGKARSKTTLVGLLIVERFGLNKAHGLESYAMLSLRHNIAHGHRIRMFNMCNTETPLNMALHQPGLPSGCFPRYFLTKILYIQIQYSLLDFIILTIMY
jgi:hypothetical protein